MKIKTIIISGVLALNSLAFGATEEQKISRFKAVLPSEVTKHFASLEVVGGIRLKITFTRQFTRFYEIGSCDHKRELVIGFARAWIGSSGEENGEIVLYSNTEREIGYRTNWSGVSGKCE